MTNSKAAIEYQKRISEIDSEIRKLKMALKNHQKNFVRQGSTGWDYVGDLGYILEKLSDIRNFDL